MKKSLSQLKTDKDVFDYIQNHLLTQNSKSQKIISRDENGEVTQSSCLYRGDNNTRCAVGAIISNKYYKKIIEGLTVDDPLVTELIEESLPNWKITKNNLEMLSDLQFTHDHVDIDCWQMRFKQMKSRFKNNKYVVKKSKGE